MFNNPRLKRKGFLLFSLFFIFMVWIVGYFLWDSVQTQSIERVRQQIGQWQLWLTGVRWFFMTLLAVSLPAFCFWLAKNQLITQALATQIIHHRRRILIWLVVLELVVGQGVLIKAFGLLAGNNP